MKRLLFTILFFCCVTLQAQPNDFVLLKKNNKTIARYFAGSAIELTTNTGAYITANITALKNDSIFLKEYVVRQAYTAMGFYVLDTTGIYYYQYHYKEIKAIGKSSGRRFDFSGSGASLIGGGMVLMLASGVVYIADRNKFSPELLGAAAALTGIGYLLIKTSGKGMTIGKKYSLVYINSSANKKP